MCDCDEFLGLPRRKEPRMFVLEGGDSLWGTSVAIIVAIVVAVVVVDGSLGASTKRLGARFGRCSFGPEPPRRSASQSNHRSIMENLAHRPLLDRGIVKE